MRLRNIVLLAAGIGYLVKRSRQRQSVGSDLQVVDDVDLARYAGMWYEIARYAASFEQDCVGSTADYTLRPDGRIEVVNRCRHCTMDGPVRKFRATARVVDPQTNAKLKVGYFWPLEGDYWIIDLDRDYQWAVVGEPNRKYLWILARTPQLDHATYQSILAGLPAKGYDPDRLIRTEQPQHAPTASL